MNTGIESINNNDKRVYSFIRNQIIHGKDTPTLKEINEITGKSSPRSAVLVLERLERAGLIKRMGRKIRLISGALQSNTSISAVDVPLVGTIAAGIPILAVENIETTIPVSTGLATPGSKYFLLRVSGSSMNLKEIKGGKIEDGSIVLVRQQNTADDGDVVVALINDKATIKTLERKNGMVILKPKSSDPHNPIVLTENCLIQGVAVAVLPRDLYESKRSGKK